MKYLVYTALFLTLSAHANDRYAWTNEYQYQVGTEEGCSSGERDAGNVFKSFTKDIDMYVNKPYYKSGWDDGYRQCNQAQQNLNDIVNRSVIGW